MLRAQTPLEKKYDTPDYIIKLNVGGKEFTTTKHIILSSPTLVRIVEEGEKNPKMLTSEGAFFIDRDYDVFHVILEHLRNVGHEVTRPGTFLFWHKIFCFN